MARWYRKIRVQFKVRISYFVCCRILAICVWLFRIIWCFKNTAFWTWFRLNKISIGLVQFKMSSNNSINWMIEMDEMPIGSSYWLTFRSPSIDQHQKILRTSQSSAQWKFQRLFPQNIFSNHFQTTDKYELFVSFAAKSCVQYLWGFFLSTWLQFTVDSRLCGQMTLKRSMAELNDENGRPKPNDARFSWNKE